FARGRIDDVVAADTGRARGGPGHDRTIVDVGEGRQGAAHQAAVTGRRQVRDMRHAGVGDGRAQVLVSAAIDEDDDHRARGDMVSAAVDGEGNSGTSVSLQFSLSPLLSPDLKHHAFTRLQLEAAKSAAARCATGSEKLCIRRFCQKASVFSKAVTSTNCEASMKTVNIGEYSCVLDLER